MRAHFLTCLVLLTAAFAPAAETERSLPRRHWAQ